jgi:hypothetical protein
MISEDLQALLEELREPEAAHREDHTMAPYFEDEEVSDDETSNGEVEDNALVLGGGNNESAVKPQGESSDERSNDGTPSIPALPTPEDESSDKRSNDGITSIPALPMPELTPPRVILAAALNISDRLQGSPVEGSQAIPDPGGLASPATVSQLTPGVERLAISTTAACTKYIHTQPEGACEAAFSAGRLATNVAQYHGRILSKIRVLELVNGLRSPLEARESRQGRKSSLIREALPNVAPRRGTIMAASVTPTRQIHRRDLPPPPKN